MREAIDIRGANFTSLLFGRFPPLLLPLLGDCRFQCLYANSRKMKSAKAFCVLQAKRVGVKYGEN